MTSCAATSTRRATTSRSPMTTSKAVRPEATQSVQIVEFVELDQINPMYFDTPYYLEPKKKGRHAYALLRDALIDSGSVAIARVVIRSREHIAASSRTAKRSCSS